MTTWVFKGRPVDHLIFNKPGRCQACGSNHWKRNATVSKLAYWRCIKCSETTKSTVIAAVVVRLDETLDVMHVECQADLQLDQLR